MYSPGATLSARVACAPPTVIVTLTGWGVVYVYSTILSFAFQGSFYKRGGNNDTNRERSTYAYNPEG